MAMFRADLCVLQVKVEAIKKEQSRWHHHHLCATIPGHPWTGVWAQYRVQGPTQKDSELLEMTASGKISP